MVVWIRVISFTIDMEGCKPELGVVVYPTEAAAKAAAKESGGLALPVASDYMKTLFTPEQFPIDGVVQFHRSAILSEHNGSDASLRYNAFDVDATSLPHEAASKVITRNGEEDTIHRTEYGDEAQAWFATLEAELECFVHCE
jgi:hypothetical protein